MKLRPSILLATLLPLVAPLSAFALTEQDADWCNGTRGTKVTDQAKGCTAIIESGRFTGIELAAAYANRGIAYNKQRQYDLALQDCRHALEASKTDPLVFLMCGNAYTGKKRYDEAIAAYGEAITVGGKSSMVLNNRGSVYAIKGDFDLALADYSAAIEANPRNGKAYSNRAGGFLLEKDAKSALRDFNEALLLNPNSLDTRARRGVAHLAVGDASSVGTDFLAVSTLDPKNAMALYGTGLILKRKGDPAATRYAGEAENLQSDIADWFTKRGVE